LTFVSTDQVPSQGKHPIQVVARRTGLTLDVIRMWERRYGAVRPLRSGTNRRLYTDEEVERLALLRRATLLARSIGAVAKLPTGGLASLVEADEAAAVAGEAPAEPSPPSAASDHLRECLEALDRPDPAHLRAALSAATLDLGTIALLDQVVAPLLQKIGERWAAGSLAVWQEHLAVATIRPLLESLRESRAGAGIDLVVATPARQHHEMGALMAAAIAAAEGFRVTYLGADAPSEDIAAAAARCGARAVALSIVHPAGDSELATDLRKLRRVLPGSVRVYVGGGAAESYDAILEEIGATRCRDLRSFRTLLQHRDTARR
jgi:methylmalonyl-CoA mutase cobalamin-binding subunit